MRQPELGDLQRGLELACQGRALTQAPHAWVCGAPAGVRGTSPLQAAWWLPVSHCGRVPSFY